MCGTQIAFAGLPSVNCPDSGKLGGTLNRVKHIPEGALSPNMLQLKSSIYSGRVQVKRQSW